MTRTRPRAAGAAGRVVLLLALAPTAAHAQIPRDTAGLPEIVVTADREPVPPDSVAATLTVLTGDELRSQGIAFVADALRQVPGMQVVQGGSFGAATSTFIRGGESNYVKVLVDGVAVNQPGGAYDFAGLTTDNVDRIEILRGPASVLYGSDAVSGVVQIFTRDGGGPTAVAASAEAGTYGTVRWDADVHGGGDGLGWSASLSRFTSDGVFDFNNAYRNTAASARLRVRPAGGTTASLALRYTDARFNFPTDFTGAPVDRNQFNTDQTTTLSLEVDQRLARGLNAQLLLGRNANSTGFDNAPDPAPGSADQTRSLADVERRTADARLVLHALPRSTIMAGAAFDDQHEESFSQSDGQFGPSNDAFAASRDNWGFYLQGSTELLPRVRLTAGGRLDDNERFGDFWTYRVSGVAFLAPYTRVRASAGTAFKEPSFFENFATGFVTGNPALRPERSRSFEAGVEQDLLGGRLGVRVTGFLQRFRDLIQFTGTTAAAGDPNYVNVGAANADGVEAEVALRRAGPVSAGVGYTWLRTRVKDAGFDNGPDAEFVTGGRLLRRPEHSVSARVSATVGARARVGAVLAYVGPRDDIRFASFPDPSRRETLPGYVTVDVSGGLTVVPSRARAPGLGFSLRVENLFGESYEQVAGFPARGRTVLVGLTTSYR